MSEINVEKPYSIMVSAEDVIMLQNLITYCADPVEFDHFIEHLHDNVEVEWGEWEDMEDIPEGVLKEFDETTSHIYRDAYLLEKLLHPVLRQINQDSIKALQHARDTK